MNDKRRSLLKTASKLPGKLFSHDIPVTTLLFGDKFDDEIKTLDTDKKLRESMSEAQQSNKYGLGKNAGGPLRGGKGSNTRISQTTLRLKRSPKKINLTLHKIASLARSETRSLTPKDSQI